MKNIIVACAGGYGIEIYNEIIANNIEAKKDGKEQPYNFLGFLSDVPVDLEEKNVHEKIIGTIKDWKPSGDEYVIVGLAKPDQKRKVYDLLEKQGAKFISIVSPYAIVAKNSNIGIGCIITGGSIISGGVSIGDFVNINGSMLYSGAEIGNYSTTTGYTVVENAHVGEGVFIGTKAVVSEGCNIGDWSQIYAGSVVTENITAGVQVFGMPAKEIG